MSIYLCIDLKSFYASVECVEMGLDPMKADLVVADPSRGKGTICLAVSPSLKAKGVKNRCRVYEIPENISYIMAPPRMQLYIDYAAMIHQIFLKYVSSEDIHVYSIDESFLDVSDYLDYFKMTPKELAQTIMSDILYTTGLTATAGIGTNLYLTKIALDITAKHVDDHIGYLDEKSYIEQLWDHTPLTDFWMIASGKARRLADKFGCYTMRDIAYCDEDKLYKEFGIDAELLIDHAWGREPVRICDIKGYKSKSHSLSNGQVLFRNYSASEAKTVLKEMAIQSCLDLVKKRLVTGNIGIFIAYDHLIYPGISAKSRMLNIRTSSRDILVQQAEKMYDEIVLKEIPIRRLGISFNDVVDEKYETIDLFTDEEKLQKDRNLQRTILQIKEAYGDNAILQGMDLTEEGTTIERNNQIGGHQKLLPDQMKYGHRKKEKNHG